jgi:hypothetical protein
MAETTAERAAREAQEQRDWEAAAARAKALDEYEAKYADVHAAAIAVLNIKVSCPSSWIASPTTTPSGAPSSSSSWANMPSPITSSPMWSTMTARRGCR